MTTPPSPEVARHLLLEKTRATIKAHGWMLVATEDDDGVPFAYTVGLTEKGLPELYLGNAHKDPSAHTSIHDASRILNRLAGDAVRTGTLKPGMALADGAMVILIRQDDLKPLVFARNMYPTITALSVEIMKGTL